MSVGLCYRTREGGRERGTERGGVTSVESMALEDDDLIFLRRRPLPLIIHHLQLLWYKPLLALDRPTPVLGQRGPSDSEDPPIPVTLLSLLACVYDLLNVDEKVQLFLESDATMVQIRSTIQ